jgi:uncharacterized membrane protein
MERDESVIVMGEDNAGGEGSPGEEDAWGGVLGVTKGLYHKFPGRVLDTPISESAFIGAAIGAVTGHVKGGMSNDDLRSLGEVLNNGQAGLIAVYATNMADQVAASIKAQNRQISQAIDADADELAKELKAAEASS